jgi:acetoin utilization protein AcuB
MADKKLTVGGWMTPNPITIDADASVIEAIHLLKENKIRRLPVMKKGKLAGLVTERMLAAYTPGKATSLDQWEVHGLLDKTKVRAAMNAEPYTVHPETLLAEATQLLHDKKLNGVLVVDDHDELAGIFTTTNVFKALIHFAGVAAGS